MRRTGRTNQDGGLPGRRAYWYNYAGSLLQQSMEGMFLREGAVPGRSQSLVTVVLRDIHFWIPVVVLLGGLVVLRWIH